MDSLPYGHFLDIDFLIDMILMQPLFEIIIFLIAVFLAFFIPGDLLVRKCNLSIFQRLVLGIGVGMVLWGWQGFILGYLGLRALSYLYVGTLFLLWVKIQGNKFVKEIGDKFSLKNIDWVVTSLIILGVGTQLSAVWFNGVYIKEGFFFCCGNLFDSILHTALVNQVVKNFPPFEPGMYGEIVRNYHYWGNLIIGELVRVFHLPLISTQNQYSMLLISGLLGLSSIVFGQISGLGRNFYRWLVFFLYFGGDLIFLLVSFIRKEVNFQMSSLEDGTKFLVNPPRAISIVIFFIGLSLLLIWVRKKNFSLGLLAIFILASTIGLKVYTGFFVLTGLFGLLIFFTAKKNFKFILLFFVAVLLSAIIYLPVNKGAGGLYFTGLSLFENFIVQPWMMLDRLELARKVYLDHRSWLRVMQYEIIFAFIFIVTVFGTKLLGLLQSRKSLSRLPVELHVFLISGMTVSAVLGSFFQQYTGGANTFNFLVSIFIIGSIYTALACSYWINKINCNVKIFLIALIVILTVPRVFQETFMNIQHIQAKKGFIIDNFELNGIKYLKEKTKEDSLVMVDYNVFKVDAEGPYISFLADRPMFLSGLGNELTAHGIDFSARKRVVDAIMTSHNPKKMREILLKNKINYIFLSVDSRFATESAQFSSVVFENSRVRVLKNNW